MPKVELILRDIRDERAETTGLARPEKMVVDTEGNFTIGNKVIKFDLRVFKGVVVEILDVRSLFNGYFRTQWGQLPP